MVLIAWQDSRYDIAIMPGHVPSQICRSRSWHIHASCSRSAVKGFCRERLVRHRSAGIGKHRAAVRRSRPVGHATGDRGRRWKFHPRGHLRRGWKYPPRHRRLHGHAGHGPQRGGVAGDDGEDGPADAGAVGHQRVQRVRAVHPPPRRAPSGEGPRADPGRGNWQSILHHRHLRRPAGHRARRGRVAQGDQGGWDLLGRSQSRSHRPHAAQRDATSTCWPRSCA